MYFRKPDEVRGEFLSADKRALILTTVVHESRAVKAHLATSETIFGQSGNLYELGRFSDPAADWLVVHAITQPGNSDAGLIASKALQEFGPFHVQMFVGIAGSLKDDIPIGSVVIGDYVYNGHSAKIDDEETFTRPHARDAAPELLGAAQYLVYNDDEWQALIRAPAKGSLPAVDCYPCPYPPAAFIKAIFSGEEVLATNKAARYELIRRRFNDAAAVEMEGWGLMNAAYHGGVPAIVVRGISDMCGGKGHAADAMNQPIASAHAAAFAFAILSVLSRNSPPRARPEPSEGVDISPDVILVAREGASEAQDTVQIVLNFDGAIEDWTPDMQEAAVLALRSTIPNESLRVVRVEQGSVRVIIEAGSNAVSHLSLQALRRSFAPSGLVLKGYVPASELEHVLDAQRSLLNASVDLLAWGKNTDVGWIDRPEQDAILERFSEVASTTVLLGPPGAGKSSLLSHIAAGLLEAGGVVLAIKADLLDPDLTTEEDLQRELVLPDLPSKVIKDVARLAPVYVFLDQVDALASHLDLKSARLSVLLNLVKRLSGVANVHVVLSARTFEFEHDARLKAIDAAQIVLDLPAWAAVQNRLEHLGIDASRWPDAAREVVRTPQALTILVALAQAGNKESFSTYHEMLEFLWSERVTSKDSGGQLAALARDLASAMAEEETLWLAAARYEARDALVRRLEALGILLRSDNGLSIGFSHQTVFEFVLARTFTREAGLLSRYVLDRQDSLFVRPKLWAALHYLRAAQVTSYQQEVLTIWKQQQLRRHLRLLLIEFLGQVRAPLEFEALCVFDALQSPDWRIIALDALRASSDWLPILKRGFMPDAMIGPDAHPRLAGQILANSWGSHPEDVAALLQTYWLPQPECDDVLWSVLEECPEWSPSVQAMALQVLKRSSISPWAVDNLALQLAVNQPEAALLVIRARLDYSLEKVVGEARPGPPPAGLSDDAELCWHLDREERRNFGRLLEMQEWTGVIAIAEQCPGKYLEVLWPWYLAVFLAAAEDRDEFSDEYVFNGRWSIVLDIGADERGRDAESPLVVALETAIQSTAKSDPDAFLRWAGGIGGFNNMCVQQLIALGFSANPETLAREALEWLLRDPRRLQLGTCHGLRCTTIALLRASAAQWSEHEIVRFERYVLSYRPSTPNRFTVEQRRIFLKSIRAARHELLAALGEERLSKEARDVVRTEDRALGGRFERLVGPVTGGYIGSPMDAAAMARAKDEDILRIFNEVPDRTDWDHPTDWMRGGNIQLSRSFAEFAKEYPDRAIELLSEFRPGAQERAAGYALDAMAGELPLLGRVLELFVRLDSQGFASAEFRESAARSIEKIATQRKEIPDRITDLLVEWLAHYRDEGSKGAGGESDEAGDTTSDTPAEDVEGSVLWGLGSITVLPSGPYSILSALATILLRRGEEGLAQFLEVASTHLASSSDAKLWKHLLERFSYIGSKGSAAAGDFLRALFAKHPELFLSKEGVVFLAHVQNWDRDFVELAIDGWQESGDKFRQQAYGELVGLVVGLGGPESWQERWEIAFQAGAEASRVGMAYAAANLFAEPAMQVPASAALVRLIGRGDRKVVAAALEVFRASDWAVIGKSGAEVLSAFARVPIPSDLSSPEYLVERLQSLLPAEASTVAAIAANVVNSFSEQLGDLKTGVATCAPQLTDIALTLHRMPGELRLKGLELFEALVTIRAYGATETLAEIDGRFGVRSAPRARLGRRRPARKRRHFVR